MTSPPAPLRPSSRIWTTAYVAGMFALVAIAATIGLLVYRELREMKAPEDDAGWVIFQLGFEHQRLLIAAETNAPADEIALRGDIYLSRVFLVRDAPLLASVRDSIIKESLTDLFQSAQRTEELLAGVSTIGGRALLLAQLRGDSKLVRELMLDMSAMNRQLQAESRTQRTQSLLFYLAVLEILLLALLGLGIVVLRVTRKLRAAGLELEAQFATQNAIMRSVDNGILGLGPQGRVLYSNPLAVNLLGSGAASGAVLPPAGGEGLVREIRLLLDSEGQKGEGGLYGSRIAHCKTPDGTRHYLLRKFRAAAAGPEEEEDASLIVTIADVTAEEDAKLRREEYDARIGEVSRLLAYAAISGGIVHEISQPLAAIRNYIYALKVSLSLKPGSEEHRAIADHLGEEIDRAIEVVRNVRRMGPQDLQDSGICDVHEAIVHSVRLVTLGSNPPPPIAIAEPPELPLVTGSLPLIGQVIVNLLKNALSASAAAGHPGAEVTVSIKGSFAEIAVADFGAGVSADAAKSLFSPFSKSARGGMGLGLAICQRIAANLGGGLSWENRDGAGAVFKFSVPIAKEGTIP